jgi:hypothetical protein
MIRILMANGSQGPASSSHVNCSISTTLTFRYMLLKRAHTRGDFEKFIAQSEFHQAQIEETPIGLEIRLQK